jgi:hypothetical protein
MAGRRAERGRGERGKGKKRKGRGGVKRKELIIIINISWMSKKRSGPVSKGTLFGSKYPTLFRFVLLTQIAANTR